MVILHLKVFPGNLSACGLSTHKEKSSPQQRDMNNTMFHSTFQLWLSQCEQTIIPFPPACRWLCASQMAWRLFRSQPSGVDGGQETISPLSVLHVSVTARLCISHLTGNEVQHLTRLLCLTITSHDSWITQISSLIHPVNLSGFCIHVLTCKEAGGSV